ncbi:MAG: hypothetical protein EBU90_21855 [Proteobacteria bacterium]|nr:hypothetical protein [Pseudomonadota bacterium]NBP16005.1 hypothetical protein [bacterium]
MSAFEEDSEDYLPNNTSDTESDSQSTEHSGSNWVDQNCLNESPITLTEYTTDDVKDLISIKFLNPRSKKFNRGNCITRSELAQIIQSDTSSEIKNYIQCIYTSTDDPSGIGGKPTLKLVCKLPLGVFITIRSLKKIFTDRSVSTWYALEMYGGKRRRIGNVHGMFGMSMNHGQVPGFKVYKLFTKDDLKTPQTVHETFDDYILHKTQILLLPFANGHSGVGGVNAFVNDVIQFVIPDQYKPFDVEIEKYKIEYTDPTNFIYVMNNVTIDSVKNPDGSFKLAEVYRLYTAFYDKLVINCADLGIGSIPIYPNVVELICAMNNIKELHSYPNLKHLIAYENHITKIGDCPKLEDLNVTDNWFVTLNGPFPNLQTLECGMNEISTLPSFNSLKKLDCRENNLTSIPQLPLLMALNCSNNFITNLPYLPQLISCNCDNNVITELTSTRTSNLINMSCKNNRLTEIPNYRGLVKLYCDNNQITQLPKFLRLVELTCSNNQITELGDYPTLKTLDCRNNPLSHIGSLRRLECVSYDRNVVSAPHLQDLPECP